MTNKENLKKLIIYRATHRGFKEMDLLLGNFVKKYINDLDEIDLNDLRQLLLIEDQVLYKWHFENKITNSIPKTKVSSLLKNFKL